MKSPILYIIYCLSFLSLFSCECDEEPIPFGDGMVSPFQATSVLDGDEIFIFFNKILDTANVELNKNITVRILGLDPYFGTFKKGPFELVFDACDLGCDEPNGCEIEIKMEGENSDASVIVSSDNQVLDGDGDATDGGDFIDTVLVACGGIAPPKVITPKYEEAFPMMVASADSLSFELTFDQPMEDAVLIANSSVSVFNLTNDVSIPIALIPSEPLPTASYTVISTISAEEICPNVFCELEISIIGSDVFSSSTGLFLDANCDGVAPDDFIATIAFEVL